MGCGSAGSAGSELCPRCTVDPLEGKGEGGAFHQRAFLPPRAYPTPPPPLLGHPLHCFCLHALTLDANMWMRRLLPGPLRSPRRNPGPALSPFPPPNFAL